MKTAAELLRAARTLLTDPSRWTTEAYARCEDGTLARPTYPEAVRWCAYGALAKVGGGEWDREGNLLRRAGHDLFGTIPTSVNDCQGHDAVLRMYDRAIELAEAQS